MKNTKLVIKRKDKVETIERIIYETEDSIDVNEIVSNLTNPIKCDSKDLFKIQTSISAKLKLLSVKDINDLCKKIYSLKNNEDFSNFVVEVKNLNRKLIIKSVVEENIKTINSILKEKGLATINSDSEINIDELEELYFEKTNKSLIKDVEKKLSKDKFNKELVTNPESMISIFMNKLFSLYYVRRVQAYKLKELEDMNRELSLGDESCLERICDETNSEIVNNYSKKIVSDLIFKNYSNRLKHICWAEHCDNAEVTKCSKIATSALDITKNMFDYITFGVMIVEDNSVERCVVLKCRNYERCHTLPTKIENKVEKQVESKQDNFESLRRYNSSSGRTFIPSTPIKELTKEEKEKMLTVREREELKRKNELIDASQKVKTIKKTK